MPVTLSADAPQTVLLVVQTPYKNGRLDREEVVTYRVTPHPANDSGVSGEAQTLSVTVHTKGFYVPGPQIFGAMLAIALAAILLRRR